MNTTRRFHLQLLLASATLCTLSGAAVSSTKVIMDENTFWQIIEAAKTSAGPSYDARPEALEAQLTPLALESLTAFQRRYESYLIRANRWDLWGAAYLMNGGCSDDGFKYFRDWLISEGRGTYESALANPESLEVFPRREYFELESFGYAASKVFARKGGGELERDFNLEVAAPQGKEWKESELPAMFPKLAKKYEAK
jgi:hypothetical protein